MERDNALQIVILIIAVVALIVAVFSVVVPEEDEDKKEPENVAPTASITVANTTVEEMTNILFDASGSTDSDGTIVEYTWDFGDGGKAGGMYSGHAFTSSGTYTVTLTVVDNDGANDIASITMTVNEHVAPVNIPPVASFSVSETTLEVHTYIYLDGSTSIDSDGTIVIYKWDFGDGTNATGMYLNHYYTSPGSYTITLTVLDNEGAADSSSVNITVTEEEAPAPNQSPDAVIYVENTTAEVGSYINFNGSESSDSDGTIVEYTWDFGDGTKESGMHANHIYQTEGSYNVTLTVIDDDGDNDTANITITVIEETTITTPTVSMYWNEDAEIPGRYMGCIVSISGTSGIFTEDVTVVVTCGNESEAKDLDQLAAGDNITVGTLTLNFTDLPPEGKLGAEDVFIITGGSAGDIIRLIYKPTGGQMGSFTLN